MVTAFGGMDESSEAPDRSFPGGGWAGPSQAGLQQNSWWPPAESPACLPIDPVLRQGQPAVLFHLQVDGAAENDLIRLLMFVPASQWLLTLTVIMVATDLQHAFPEQKVSKAAGSCIRRAHTG